ncbi:MAG: HEAT repeat domain-containing protein [Actinomycetota bacterium]
MNDRNPFSDEEEVERLHIAVVVAGHSGDVDFVLTYLHHPQGRIRASALNALERLGRLDDSVLTASALDPDPAVRRRVAEIASRHTAVDLLPLLGDADSLVVEMAAWACGEQMQTRDDTEFEDAHSDVNGEVDPDRRERVIDRLMALAGDHKDALVRESAVAALGAIGDERSLSAVLSGCSDKPAIRRRAVLALSQFSGPEVDAALLRALEDRDWQVRQAAEDVLGPAAQSVRGTFDDEEHSEQDEQD